MSQTDLNNEILQAKENIIKQNRVWIRISSACNSQCKFCLDADNLNGTFASKEDIKQKIQTAFKQNIRNKLILSGGEASINPDFIDYIKYAKTIGYDRVQTITNGIRFADFNFTDNCIKAGLEEVTFSIHGNTAQLHDLLVGVKGAFLKSVSGLKYIKTNYPSVIVNVDICVNKINYQYLADTIIFFMKLGVYEFDILQIVPFGRGFNQYRSYLFYDLEAAFPFLKKAWLLKNITGAYIFTNRFPAEILENNEDLIQDHNKIAGEILEENQLDSQQLFEQKQKKSCFGEACKYCFLQQYCTILHNWYEDKYQPLNQTLVDFTPNVLTNSSLNHQIFQVRGYKFISDLLADWGNNLHLFQANIKKINQLPIPIYNLPKCLCPSSLGYTSITDYQIKSNKFTKIDEIVEIYINDLYRKKSLRCKNCVYNESCEGIHISFIRAYGFKILQPCLS